MMVRRGPSGLAHHNETGFSLIELMLTMVFVALGSMMIQGTMLRAADVYGRYTNTLKTLLWADEQAQRAREALLMGDFEPSKSGMLEAPNKEFSWTQDMEPLETPNLYRLDLHVTWTESGKPFELQRSQYVYQKDASQGL